LKNLLKKIDLVKILAFITWCYLTMFALMFWSVMYMLLDTPYGGLIRIVFSGVAGILVLAIVCKYVAKMLGIDDEFRSKQAEWLNHPEVGNDTYIKNRNET